MQRFNFNLFRYGRMVQIGQHWMVGTLQAARQYAAQLVESEAVDLVSIENKSGRIVGVAR